MIIEIMTAKIRYVKGKVSFSLTGVFVVNPEAAKLTSLISGIPLLPNGGRLISLLM
jgi:hypothetical protein